MASTLKVEELKQFVRETWDKEIIPQLEEYITIPNQSPLFDAHWAENGHTDKAVELMTSWVKTQDVKGLKMEVVRLESRTPLIFIEIEASESASSKVDTVLLYGHLDKQPPLADQWEEGLGPYKPVIKDGKLYGRGGADDGYAVYAAITAIKALQLQGATHARSVIIVEACEESGSPDLPAYIVHLKERIGSLSLIVCLDSGCGNYDQFWMTSSLRGLCSGNLRVDILREGVHSGHASGVVPSSFRIVRQLLARLEDVNTGKVLPECFYCEIPPHRVEQAKVASEVLGDLLVREMPFVEGARSVEGDMPELMLNRTWRPALSVTGVEGFPTLAAAGNVLRPYSAFKLSLRLPPNVEGKKALQGLKEILEKDPPYGAKVHFEAEKAATGWESPKLVDWLEESIEKASETYFHKKHCYMGEGGTIPFMGMLGSLFPQAQFVITGVLGPASNAHGPNEFLHIEMGKNVTCCVVNILADHAQHLSN